MPTSCIFYILKTDEISGTLRLMHDGISFDKILPKQVPSWLLKTTLENREFGQNAHSVTSRFSLAGSLLLCIG
jgi:hypothetical protein